MKKSEKYLMILVLLTLFGAVGYTFRSSVGIDLSFMSTDLDQKKSEIERMIQNRKKGIEYRERFKEMDAELTLEGNDSEQFAAIRRHILDIFNKVGLRDSDYQRISEPEVDKQDDFKIVSYNINQILCTPAQVGRLLYELEKSSNVIEINSCVITNEYSDVGRIGMRSLEAKASSFRVGLLSVNLEISRLVKYRQGEAPKKKGKNS